MCFQSDLKIFGKICCFLIKIIRSFWAKLKAKMLFICPECFVYGIFALYRIILPSRSSRPKDVALSTGTCNHGANEESLCIQIDDLENEKQEKDRKIEELTRAVEIERQSRINDAWQNSQRVAKFKDDLNRAEVEKQDALTRLSALMSVKLRDNNPNIADLSDPYRPTKLAEMFSELYDNEWTDAFTCINSVLSERQTITLLLDILMEIYSFCSEELDRTWSVVSDWYIHDSLPNEQQIRKQLKDSRKVVVVNMTPRMSERYQGRLQSVCAVQTLRHMLSSEILQNYVQQSVRMCLLMSANDPPVVIECQDSHSTVPANITSADAAKQASGMKEKSNSVNTPTDEENTVNKEKSINEGNADKDEKQLGQEQLNMEGQPIDQNNLEESTNDDQPIHEENTNMKKTQLYREEPKPEGIQTSEVIIEINSKSDVQQNFQRRPFDREKYKEYTSRGPYLEYIVWPVMYLHQGGPMLGKGVAQGTREAVGDVDEEYWTWKKPE